MKKKLITTICMMAFVAMPALSQTPGGGTFNDSTYVNTQPGTWVPQAGGDEQFPGEVGDVPPLPIPEEII